MAEPPAELAALVLREVASLLERLTPVEIGDLAAGRRRLRLADGPLDQVPSPPERLGGPPAAGSPARSAGSRSRGASGADPDEVRSTVMTMSSRAEAARYLGDLGSIPVLKALADAFGIRVSSKDRRAEVIRKIVDGTVGLELTARAIRPDASTMDEAGV